MSNPNVLIGMAEAFKKGGIQAVYNFPGFYSHKLFDELGGTITSTNEKIAYEMAWGSSQAGKPALVTFKNVGLNDAADPFINSMLTGAGSGLVLTVFDDIELEGSQCILDSRHYFDFYGGLWFEPFDYSSATNFAEAAPQLSHIFDIPVVIRLTNESLHFEKANRQHVISAAQMIKLASAVVNPSLNHVEPLVHPINADVQRKMMGIKNNMIQQFVNDLHKHLNGKGMHGSAYCGHSSSEANSHIATLPVPLINADEINAVFEVGDSIIAEKIRLQNSTENFISRTIGYNSKNAENYIITSRYESLFGLLKPHYQFITGDLGEYTKDTLSTLTHCLCFGSAISVAVGMREAEREALAITGDASFFHSAKNVFAEADLRNISVKVVLIDNGGSQGTGGQKIPGIMLGNIATSEIDLDTINDTELARAVSTFVTYDKSAILKVNVKE